MVRIINNLYLYGTECKSLIDLGWIITHAYNRGLITTTEDVLDIFDHNKVHFPPYNGQPAKKGKSKKIKQLKIYRIRKDLKTHYYKEEYLVCIILKAKDLYYHSGYVMMSDDDFDKTEELLRKINPNSDVLTRIG